jgi:hypothetical protein
MPQPSRQESVGRQFPRMRFDTYSGLASAVGIVLILMIVAWLGLWGPVNLAKLQDWQTLMTGFMALVAAGVAYWGATAKVRHDREVIETENKRRRLALYLKIEFAFRQLIERARARDTKFMFASVASQTFEASDFALEEPPELEEAWMYLDAFPRHLIAEIRTVRNSLRKLAALKADVGDKRISLASGIEDRPWNIDQAHLLLTEIWHSAVLVADDLLPLIREFAPEMDDRMTRIYGDPDGDTED